MKSSAYANLISFTSSIISSLYFYNFGLKFILDTLYIVSYAFLSEVSIFIMSCNIFWSFKNCMISSISSTSSNYLNLLIKNYSREGCYSNRAYILLLNS